MISLMNNPDLIRKILEHLGLLKATPLLIREDRKCLLPGQLLWRVLRHVFVGRV
jgi:hypothetical protein